MRAKPHGFDRNPDLEGIDFDITYRIMSLKYVYGLPYFLGPVIFRMLLSKVLWAQAIWFWLSAVLICSTIKLEVPPKTSGFGKDSPPTKKPHDMNPGFSRLLR